MFLAGLVLVACDGTERVRVGDQGATLREQPDGLVVRALEPHAELQVLSRWLEVVTADGAHGWVLTAQTKAVEPPEARLGAAAGPTEVLPIQWLKVNVRLAPNGPVAATLARGTPVSILERRGEWRRARAAAVEGWIVFRAVEPFTETPAPTVPEDIDEDGC
jgi:SH3-like domain-containing protein